MSDKLPVKFEVQDLEALPIKLISPPKGYKKAANRALAEAQAFAKFGIHALRVKSKVLAMLGKEANDAGIKHLGHGKVIVASNNAEEAINKIGEMITRESEQEKPNFELIVELLRLQKEFNTQLIMTAQVHLNVAKAAPDDSGSGPQLTVPLPAGQPVMIVSNPKST